MGSDSMFTYFTNDELSQPHRQISPIIYHSVFTVKVDFIPRIRLNISMKTINNLLNQATSIIVYQNKEQNKGFKYICAHLKTRTDI